jgi:hypothetical protein
MGGKVYTEQENRRSWIEQDMRRLSKHDPTGDDSGGEAKVTYSAV